MNFIESKRIASPVRGLLVALVAVGLITATGCKSPAEKKYEEGKELRKRQLLDEALVAFDEAADLFRQEDGEVDKAYYKIGSIYKERGQNDKAIEYYKLAIEANPDDIKYYRKLMRSYVYTEQAEKALDVYEEIKDHPELKYDIKERQELELERDFAKQALLEEQEGTAGDGGDTSGGSPAAAPPDEDEDDD